MEPDRPRSGADPLWRRASLPAERGSRSIRLQEKTVEAEAPRCGKAERLSYRTPALIHTEALPFRFSGFARRTLAFETWDAPASAPRRLQGWPSAVCFAARAACTI